MERKYSESVRRFAALLGLPDNYDALEFAYHLQLNHKLLMIHIQLRKILFFLHVQIVAVQKLKHYLVVKVLVNYQILNIFVIRWQELWQFQKNI